MRVINAKSKFTLIITFTALLAAVVLGILALYEARLSLTEAEFSHLTGIRTNKATQIENYFETVDNQLIVLAEDHMIIAAMVKLARGFNQLEEIDVPLSYNDSIEAYYTTEFLPRLEANLPSGVPEYNVFQPETQPGRYLQYHYISENGNAVGFKQFLNNAEDGSEYSQAHEEFHANFRELLLRFGYYDLFLVDFETGDIVYTVFKEVDYGTNLITGPHRNSGLARVVQRVMRDPIRQQTQIIDFQPYAPSYNAPAAFVAAPIYNGDHVVGILALQLPVDQINAIMTGEELWQDEGLGVSGESYLVGSDRLMRSNARQLIQGKESFLADTRNLGTHDSIVRLMDALDTTILLQEVNTEAVQAALGGEIDTRVVLNSNDHAVLSSFAPLNIRGLDWVILAEIDQEEAFAPVQRLLRNMILTGLVFILLLVLASIWLSQNFLSPVQQMIANTEKIRELYLNRELDQIGEINLHHGLNGEYETLGQSLTDIMTHANRVNVEAEEKHREYSQLLTRAMPESVAERYVQGERRIVDSATQATAIFVLVRGYRASVIEEDLEAAIEMNHELEHYLKAAALDHGIDLFEQLGSEYIGICGLTTPYLNHIERVALFAQSTMRVIRTFNAKFKTTLTCQIGIDVGRMFGGLITDQRTTYGAWGETIYIAQEVGAAASANQIIISKPIYEYLSDHEGYRFNPKAEKIRVMGQEKIVWELILTDEVPETMSLVAK